MLLLVRARLPRYIDVVGGYKRIGRRVLGYRGALLLRVPKVRHFLLADILEVVLRPLEGCLHHKVVKGPLYWRLEGLLLLDDSA